MKPFWKKYQHLSRLALAVMLGALLAVAGLPSLGLFVVCTFQLLEFAMAKPSRRGLCYTTGLTPEQLKEFEGVMRDLKDFGTFIPGIKDLAGMEGGFAVIKSLPGVLKTLQGDHDRLKEQLKQTEKLLLARNATSRVRSQGKLSDEAAEHLAAHFMLFCARNNKLEVVFPEVSLRNALIGQVRGLFGLDQKALATTDIPLPTQYFGEMRELIAEFGVIAPQMSPWVLSGGTDKPPRLKTRFSMTSTAINVQMGEKTPQVEFASLESHKFGGILYTPREIREQSIVQVGQFLARLAAAAFGEYEDTLALLGDGTATYESVKGVAKICYDNNKLVTLANGKTKPSDVVIGDFRKAMGQVNTRVLGTGKWHMHPSWIPYLPEFNTQANQYNYRMVGDTHYLLGRPIVFNNVMQAYQETAAASSYLAIYGDLSYWWFGRRPTGPRIDESSDFKFDYDQIATRFIEEADVDYMDLGAAAVIQAAAS